LKEYVCTRGRKEGQVRNILAYSWDTISAFFLQAVAMMNIAGYYAGEAGTGRTATRCIHLAENIRILRAGKPRILFLPASAE
jgi:hypothetical protein